MSHKLTFNMTCPLPISDYPTVLLGHGSGGKLMHNLIEQVFVPAFGSPVLNVRHDGASLDISGARLAFTTDSYVVHPLFFPGGNIGDLAVNGTVNDLAMCGARPLYLSTGFILEEGLPMESLWRIVQTMRQAAEIAGVQIVTGDTKVVDRGKGDGVFINTTGIGVVEHSLNIGPDSVRPGDAILLNGDIGRHGIAVMAVREGLEFESSIETDCAPLWMPVRALMEAGIEIHCLRDLTRGGMASALVEIAEAANTHIHVRENSIPVREDVRAACEILGFDPLYVANEGRFIAFVPADQADRALSILSEHRLGETPRQIGEVTTDTPGMVTMKSQIGASRIIDMLSGEQLPRIC